MPDTPDDLQRKIDAIEAQRALLGDAAVDAAIAALKAQAAPPPPPSTQGDATVGGDNPGVNVGVNTGTVQQFFGTATPGEDKATLLADYLTSLTSECQQLRLSRLVREKQTGDEQQTVPRLKLQAVYTSLTTNGEPITVHLREYPMQRMRRLTQRLRGGHPNEVPSERVREITVNFCSPPDDAFFARIGKQRGEPLTYDDLPDDVRLRLTITRPELATGAIATCQRLVLLGDPGSGKSTVLRYLALLIALHNTQQPVTLPDGWRDRKTPLPVPILCPLGAVAPLLQKTGDAHQALWQAIEQALDDKQGSRAGLRDHLKAALRRGGVLLLFDGLDELPTTGDNPRVQVARAIQHLATQTAPQSQIVVTSRSIPYRETVAAVFPAEDGWHERTIQPLAFGQVRQFVQHWYAELGHTLEDPEMDDPVARRVRDLLEKLTATGNERIQRLIESPLLLTMLAILHYNNNNIPDDRVEVYEQCVDLLLDRWQAKRTPGIEHLHEQRTLLARLAIPNLKLEQLREELDALALLAQEQPPGNDGRGLLSRFEITGRLGAFFERLGADQPNAKARMFVDGLVTEAGLLQSPADDRYAFPHLTFQEYLAACGLARRKDMSTAAYRYWTGADATRWREVLLLFAGRLRHAGGSLMVEQYAVPWLELLVQARLGEQAKAPVQRARDTALAVLSYHELGGRTALATTQIDREARIHTPLRAAILDLLTTPASGVVLNDRLLAARTLATLGDPRFPVTLEQWQAELAQRSTTFGQPTGYFCSIPAGTYAVGGWGEGVLNQPDHPAVPHALPQYWIARTPITNAQFRLFVEGDGYMNKDYWPPNGWRWRIERIRIERIRTEPTFWDETRYTQPNQPVVGVTWYDAMAYAAWLTQQLAEALPAGYGLRLPTEAEWEVAAAYARQGNRRMYPWGDTPEPDADHAIFADAQGNNLGAAAPVGVCVAGAAACGAADMAGNVFEWCASSFKGYPQAAAALKKDVTPSDRDVPVRGGSWWTDNTYILCGARLRLYPSWFDLNNLGVRVVCAPCLRGG
ncbi:MAG: SUMF1/EgtB/PvdO family nonheme iron enzyme [Chloroflexaceae bacterium]|nr:SUMF1/EgtB/PvdO family nonheme iron enzyme [Chloroflexaceae bacterium]